jgi:hypothetical protein
VSKQLHSLKRQNNLLSYGLIILSLLVIAMVFFGSLSEWLVKIPEVDTTEIAQLEERISRLENENIELRNIQDFYLARNLMTSDTIYSVQTGMLPIEATGFISPGLANGIFVETHPYIKYSIGLYETLEEANTLRKALVELGFSDAFIASYQGTTRLKIHRAE